VGKDKVRTGEVAFLTAVVESRVLTPFITTSFLAQPFRIEDLLQRI